MSRQPTPDAHEPDHGDTPMPDPSMRSTNAGEQAKSKNKSTSPSASKIPAKTNAGSRPKNNNGKAGNKPDTATGRRKITPTGGTYTRAVTRYGTAPVLAAITILALLATSTGALIITGRPDGGLFAADGPGRALIHSGLHGGLIGLNNDPDDNDETGPTGPGTINVDLNHDGHPDTRIDGNNDGDTTDPSDPTIQELTETRDTVTNTIGPDPTKTHNSEGLITPPGNDWWTLITSLAPETHLYLQPAPDANWYAMTSNQTVANQPGLYSAIHIGFPTEEAAHTYVDNTLTDQDNQWRFPLIRGSIVTFAPQWANPTTEPYLPNINPNLHPKAAAWTINFGRQNAQLADSAIDPKQHAAITTYFTGLGFTDHTIWNAVATNPNGPWVGHLTGYNPDAINFDAIAEAIADTVVYTCNADKSSCIQADTGLLDIADMMAWRNPGNKGIGGNTNMLPTNAPNDALLRYGFDQPAIIGLLNGTRSTFNGPIGYTNGWITTDGTMVRNTIPAHAPNPPD